MHTNLKEGDREDFLLRVLTHALDADVRAAVVIEDMTKRPASSQAHARGGRDDAVSLCARARHAPCT
jgi:hypothetical protein